MRKNKTKTTLHNYGWLPIWHTYVPTQTTYRIVQAVQAVTLIVHYALTKRIWLEILTCCCRKRLLPTGMELVRQRGRNTCAAQRDYNMCRGLHDKSSREGTAGGGGGHRGRSTENNDDNSCAPSPPPTSPTRPW